MSQNPYIAHLSLDQNPLWKSSARELDHLDLELTERCNNDCIHCSINRPAEDMAARQLELTTSEWKAILSEAATLGALSVRFTGGEPLLREDFEELYVFARRLGLRVLLSTNGTLITERLANLFARLRPLEKIQITIYGMKKKSYEAVTRNPGSFQAAFRGVTRLLKKKVAFVVRGALLPPNREELNEFEAWASTIRWMDRPPADLIHFDLRCRRDSKEKNHLIKRCRLSPEEEIRLLKRRKKEYDQGMKEFFSKRRNPIGTHLFSCEAGIRNGCVDAYGHLQPCLMSRHPETVYNLKSGSLRDALKNFFPKVRKMRAQNPLYLKRCARCFLRGLCEQCPAKSWVEHGALDSPVEYLCQVAHSQARFLGLIGDGENAWKVDNHRERLNFFCGNSQDG
jgi:radical SAM protein with 4Fe4S-binding SPASM domain